MLFYVEFLLTFAQKCAIIAVIIFWSSGSMVACVSVHRKDAEQKLRQLGFGISYEESTYCEYGDCNIQYVLYINNKTWTVFSVEYADDKVMDTHLYCVWQLKENVNPCEFLSKKPAIAGAHPFWDDYYQYNNDQIQTSSNMRIEFDPAMCYYQYLVDNVDFLPWVEQPFLFLLNCVENSNLTKIKNDFKETRIRIDTSLRKLRRAIRLRGLSYASYGVPTYA